MTVILAAVSDGGAAAVVASDRLHECCPEGDGPPTYLHELKVESWGERCLGGYSGLDVLSELDPWVSVRVSGRDDARSFLSISLDRLLARLRATNHRAGASLPPCRERDWLLCEWPTQGLVAGVDERGAYVVAMAGSGELLADPATAEYAVIGYRAAEALESLRLAGQGRHLDRTTTIRNLLAAKALCEDARFVSHESDIFVIDRDGIEEVPESAVGPIPLIDGAAGAGCPPLAPHPRAPAESIPCLTP